MHFIKSPTKFFLALFVCIFLAGSLVYAFFTPQLSPAFLVAFFALPFLSGFMSISMTDSKSIFVYVRAALGAALAFAAIAPAPFTFLWGAWVLPYHAAARFADWFVVFTLLGVCSLVGSLLAFLLKHLPRSFTSQAENPTSAGGGSH